MNMNLTWTPLGGGANGGGYQLAQWYMQYQCQTLYTLTQGCVWYGE